LLHFLEMPLLSQTAQQGAGVGESLQALRPFTTGEALNAPVMDLVSLVEEVDPLVAKAAAHAAIGAIKRLHTMKSTDASKLGTTAAEAGTASEGVKTEDTPTSAAPVKAAEAGTSLESAAAAVASSAEAAGIAAAVKTEDTSADGDVAMEDVSSSAATTASTAKATPSKELVAVTEEAANATTVALLATRAHQIADDTATGAVRDLVNQLLENQLRQMELKMQQLDVLEQTVVAEKEELAKEKYQLYVDRLAFSHEKLNGRSAQFGS